MTANADSFDYRGVLIDSRNRVGIPFDQRSPGTLLIPRSGVESVLRDVMAHGFEVFGLQGFERAGPVIHPRLDMIYDRDRTTVSPLDALARFGDDFCGSMSFWPRHVTFSVAD
jgi:hypothetical protein